MKISIYKSYDDLPLFLNAETVAQVLGVSISSAYELLHEPGFPVVRVGSRMVVPKKVRCLGVRPGGKRCARLKLPVMKPYVSRRRFSLPNEIWTWKLRPPAFAVLAYLQYRCCRKFGGAVTMEELAEQTRMSAGMAKASVDALTKKGLLTTDLLPLLPGTEGRNFFSLPDEVFHLGLGHSALTVYAYLLYCEDRRSHQCHPSYNTISAATGLAVNTVMKHINKLAERQYIAVERTSYIDHNGMKWNGNNLYTILPIRQAADAFYQRQLAELELAVAQQRARRKAEGPGSAFIPAGKGQGA